MPNSEPSLFQWLTDHWQSILQHPVVASLVGSFGSAFYAFPGATGPVKAVNGVFSFFIGIYGGPAIIEWRTIESKHVGALIIVACALGGLIVANAFLEWLRSTKFADYPVIRNMLNRNEP